MSLDCNFENINQSIFFFFYCHEKVHDNKESSREN